MSGLVLTPRDGLFLKDAREWAISEEGRAHSLPWPWPSTLHGALVTAVGRRSEAAMGQMLRPAEWEELAGTIRLGANLALRRRRDAGTGPWNFADRVWRVPADALFLADEEGKPESVRRLDPVAMRGASVLGPDENISGEKLWWPRLDDLRKPAAAPAWWGEEAFVRWLADDAADRPCAGAYEGLRLMRRVQAHVGIDPKTLAAEEEILFAHEVIETLDDQHSQWAIGCEIEGGAPEGFVTIGGDRRLAWVLPGRDLFAFPTELAHAFGGGPCGLRLIAVTPAIFGAGWLPDGFAAGEADYRGRLPGIEGELVLSAALVPRAASVSGWDMAKRRPKRSTRLVAPGAVYHVRRLQGRFTAADAERLWFSGLGQGTQHGFGRFVAGIWQPREDRSC